MTFDEWRRDALEAGHAWARHEGTARAVYASTTRAAPAVPAESDLAQRVRKLERYCGRGGLLEQALVLMIGEVRREVADALDATNGVRRRLDMPIIKRRIKVPAVRGRTW